MTIRGSLEPLLLAEFIKLLATQAVSTGHWVFLLPCSRGRAGSCLLPPLGGQMSEFIIS